MAHHQYKKTEEGRGAVEKAIGHNASSKQQDATLDFHGINAEASKATSALEYRYQRILVGLLYSSQGHSSGKSIELTGWKNCTRARPKVWDRFFAASYHPSGFLLDGGPS